MKQLLCLPIFSKITIPWDAFLKFSDHSLNASHFLDSSGGLFKVALHCLIISQFCQINPWELASRSIGIGLKFKGCHCTYMKWENHHYHSLRTYRYYVYLTLTTRDNSILSGGPADAPPWSASWSEMDFLFQGSSDYTVNGTSRICQDEGLRFSPASLMLFTQTSSREWWGQALSSLKRAWTWKEVPANHIFISKKSFLYSLWSKILQHVSCFNETGRYLYILSNIQL